VDGAHCLAPRLQDGQPVQAALFDRPRLVQLGEHLLLRAVIRAPME
jgi:hypothetical protein